MTALPVGSNFPWPMTAAFKSFVHEEGLPAARSWEWSPSGPWGAGPLMNSSQAASAKRHD
jgi:hypothetical protein